jgi:hypothetical protein
VVPKRKKKRVTGDPFIQPDKPNISKQSIGSKMFERNAFEKNPDRHVRVATVTLHLVEADSGSGYFGSGSIGTRDDSGPFFRLENRL